MTFIRDAPTAMLECKLILLVGVYTGLRCDTISKLEWRHLDMSQESARVFVDYESKTDQGAAGIWFAFPRRADDSALDTSLLFMRYRVIVETRDPQMVNGRL